jgi:flagellar assembly protein FliH
MSSSKIFKKDALFTPMPLVQRIIAAPGSKTKPADNGLSPSSSNDQHTPKAKIDEPKPAPSINIEAIKLDAYNQGKKDTLAQYQADFQHTIEAFAEASQQLDDHRRMLLKRSRGDIINLIIDLSKKILGQELATPRNTIATFLQGAIEQAIECEEYHVTLHPDDLAFAEEKAPELIATVRGLERIVFKTDKTITKGGCLLESAACSVDATIETQMESMKEFLEEQYEALRLPEAE